MTGDNYTLIDLAPFRDMPENFTGTPGDSVGKAIQLAFQRGFSAVILINERLLTKQDLRRMYDRVKAPAGSGPVVSVNSEIGGYLEKHPRSGISLRVNVRRTVTTYSNIVGMIRHGAPYTIIVGAHYDHLGVSRKNKVFCGADDNASGTAMIMEMARYLAQSGNKAYNYLFVAFSGEEEGLHGSTHFAAHLPVDQKSIDCMVNLDMVGRLGCEGNRLTAYGTRTSFLWHILYKETPHPGFRMRKVHGVHSFSDHWGFYQREIPVLSFTTGIHYEYHTSRDLPETINYRGMVSISRYIEDLILNKAMEEKAGFRKPSRWNTFTSNLGIIAKALDYLIAVGMEQ